MTLSCNGLEELLTFKSVNTINPQTLVYCKFILGFMFIRAGKVHFEKKENIKSH